ncbi:hypothetical protein AYI68_g7591 [Smittium mucronatum]|uniref:Homeobox domain-containing protein n=1 Tax=Smittium mucronatum TaxID=133383 RepID=A0A1R0GN96_9FUNG|nr:hypothetical protein AYI68_g7591 [Smittium mucronatum]
MAWEISEAMIQLVSSMNATSSLNILDTMAIKKQVLGPSAANDIGVSLACEFLNKLKIENSRNDLRTARITGDASETETELSFHQFFRFGEGYAPMNIAQTYFTDSSTQPVGFQTSSFKNDDVLGFELNSNPAIHWDVVEKIETDGPGIADHPVPPKVDLAVGKSGKRRFDERTKQYLQNYARANGIKPSKIEVSRLCADTGLSRKQIREWFSNIRRPSRTHVIQKWRMK